MRLMLISEPRTEGVIWGQGTCEITVSCICRESCKHAGDFVGPGHLSAFLTRVDHVVSNQAFKSQGRDLTWE